MSWWGKLFGGTFGFMLGGPLGALIGAALGHNIDAKLKEFPSTGAYGASRERIQTAFFTTTFSVMGHLSKADGHVSRDEIRLAQSVMEQMQLNPSLKKLAQKLFNQGKHPDFVLDDVLIQFKRECHQRNTLFRMFLEILIQSAYADGQLHATEKKILFHICDELGFSRAEFAHLEAMIRAAGAGGGQAQRPAAGLTVKKACDILGVSSSASDDEVKKAYRRLRSQHHPDKLVSKGLPEEMMKLAAQKSHEIRMAYDRIREERGF